MKRLIYISALGALLLSACSTGRQLSSTMADDIYYVAGERSLLAGDVERKTGLIISDGHVSVATDAPSAKEKKNYPKERDNSINPISYKIGMTEYGADDAQSRGYVAVTPEEEAGAVNGIVEREVTEADPNEGYWIGGFDGSVNDLKICEQIIRRYPEGFATFGQDSEIANYLSMSSDWNVFTYRNRYWWFPTPSNINLYHELVFGNYPKYIWTVLWNDPRFDIFTAQDFFDPFYGVGSFRYYSMDPWYNRYWSGTAWGYPWNFNYADPYWGWYGSFGWRGSWWGWDYGWGGWYGYYPPYWGHYPYWGYYPYGPDWWHGHRPGWGHHHGGGITVNPEPQRQIARTKYTTNRNARTYSSYTNRPRYRTVNTNTNRNTYNPPSTTRTYHPSYSSGSYSRGSSSKSSYGRSTTTHKGSGTSTGGRVNTGRRN